MSIVQLFVMYGIHFVWHAQDKYSPWNVLLSHLNGERSLSERWTNAERTQSEQCVNAERNLVNDMWTVSERRTRAERKREH